MSRGAADFGCALGHLKSSEGSGSDIPVEEREHASNLRRAYQSPCARRPRPLTVDGRMHT